MVLSILYISVLVVLDSTKYCILRVFILFILSNTQFFQESLLKGSGAFQLKNTRIVLPENLALDFLESGSTMRMFFFAVFLSTLSRWGFVEGALGINSRCHGVASFSLYGGMYWHLSVVELVVYIQKMLLVFRRHTEAP